MIEFRLEWSGRLLETKMIALLTQFEDHTIHARRADQEWKVTVADNVSGVEETVEMSDGEFAAVMALMIGGDEQGPASAVFYPIAERVMSRLSKELRLIP
jgi:hypothetical protein